MNTPKNNQPLVSTGKKKFPVLLILIFLLAASNLATIFYLVAKKPTSAGELARYPFLSPTREFYDKDDLIVNIQPLRDEFNAIGRNPNISIYFELLNTGANIATNKDLAIWPASLMKIPIAMAVMKKVEKGQWRLDNELILYDEDKDDKFGQLYKEPAGKRFTIESLPNEMLVNSDNTARTIFMRNLDKEEIDEVLLHLGIDDIFNTDNQVTGKKYSIFWRALFTASYLEPEHSQKLIDLMTLSPAKSYLAGGIADGVKFSHKIGVVYKENIYADSGIVYVPNRPYILTVMIQNIEEKEVEKIFHDISAKAYQYVSQY
jgi:beta-lactamase class A